MFGFRLATAVLLAAFTIAFALWLARRVAHLGGLPARRVASVMIAGAALAVVATVAERWALGYFGLSLKGEHRSTYAPLWSMVLLCAPLEEALKAAAVWPLYVGRRLVTGKVAATYAVLAAAGFAASETLLFFGVWGETSWLALARSGIALPAHLFLAGVWGYMLGGGSRDRYFGIIWLACTVFHGFYDHVVFGRGPALLVVVVPMLVMMALGIIGLLRDAPTDRMSRVTSLSIFDAPSVGSVREVMSRRGRPLLLHWILAGALVSVGVTLSFLGGAVFLGRRLGIDFSLVDEAGFQGAVPIALLALALLLAFPFSAYLIARASSAVSVLEPAWATGAAIIAVVVLFSVTEPTALVIVMAVAPVGFALACAGAWFGLDRG